MRFRPIFEGRHKSELRIISNKGGIPGTVEFVPLTGTGDGPDLLVDEDHLSFETTLGTPSEVKNVDIQNGSKFPLRVTPFVVGDDFGEYKLTNGCPGTLEPDEECTVNVQFIPTSEGHKNDAELQIYAALTGSSSELAILEKVVDLHGDALPKPAPPAPAAGLEPGDGIKAGGATPLVAPMPALSRTAVTAVQAKRARVMAISASPRLSIGAARRRGLSVSAVVTPWSGTFGRVMRTRLYVVHGGERRLVATAYRTLRRPAGMRAPSHYRMVLTSATLRSVHAGRYVIDVAVGPNRSQLATPVAQHLTLVG
jgi:hypothetical protein